MTERFHNGSAALTACMHCFVAGGRSFVLVQDDLRPDEFHVPACLHVNEQG